MTHHWRALVAGVALAGIARASEGAGAPDWETLIVADGPHAAEERQALAAAIRLLPILPARVAVIDANDARPEVRRTLLKLDSFTIDGSSVLYVLRHSTLLRGARARSSFHILALAAALWHEQVHAQGGDEHQARKREAELWTSFVRDQRIDQVTGLRYLSALAHRPDDRLASAR